MNDYRPVEVNSIILVPNPLYTSDISVKDRYEKIPNPFLGGQTVTKAQRNIRKPLHFTGFFHGWGNAMGDDNEYGVCTVTIGIIESMDGSIHEVNLEDVTFTDRT